LAGGKVEPPSLGGFIGPGPFGFFFSSGPVLVVAGPEPHPAIDSMIAAIDTLAIRRITSPPVA
jgi:hypothetical protein